MKILFDGQVPKDLSYPDANEDAVAFAEEKNRIAISDGASESFDSKTWAHLLATRYVELPELNLQWLDDSINKYLAKFDISTMSWAKEASFERGSFSSLLGVEQPEEGDSIEILAVGDSIAILLDGEELIDSFPYKRSKEFQQRPNLFCTDSTLNRFFSSPSFFTEHSKRCSLTKMQDPVVLCMTDAIGEWALRNEEKGTPVWKKLKNIRNLSELEELVLHERKSKTIRIDDVTLVSMSFKVE